jgi:phospholipase/carboxylesterase
MNAMLTLPLTFMHRPAQPHVRHPWLLVLMHGVGSNEQDLFGLAPYVPENFHVLSLRAPFRMGPGAHAWFDFSIEPNGERTINEAQEVQSRAVLEQVLSQAAAQLGIAPDHVVVGGFSQGGIMALSMLLIRPELMRAAVVWHSRLLTQSIARTAAADAFKHKQLWVSHGVQDGVIPLASAQAIRRYVGGLPIHLTYGEYPGGHEINAKELSQSMDWLQRLTTTP